MVRYPSFRSGFILDAAFRYPSYRLVRCVPTFFQVQNIHYMSAKTARKIHSTVDLEFGCYFIPPILSPKW
jgi:hypothetical protein